jgi:hypothetical protein
VAEATIISSLIRFGLKKRNGERVRGQTLTYIQHTSGKMRLLGVLARFMRSSTFFQPCCNCAVTLFRSSVPRCKCRFLDSWPGTGQSYRSLIIGFLGLNTSWFETNAERLTRRKRFEDFDLPILVQQVSIWEDQKLLRRKEHPPIDKYVLAKLQMMSAEGKVHLL